MRQDKRPDPFEVLILYLLIFICCLFFVVTDWENLLFFPFIHIR
jgi:hypothetical protein